MSIAVDTKDCTALSDAELAEMADLCADGPLTYEVGELSKQAEAWVLVTQARDNGKLKGFSFRTLNDIVPRADHKATGEERAWGSRLARRYGITTSSYDQRAFLAKGSGDELAAVFDHSTLRPEDLDDELLGRFDAIKADQGDSLIAFGWAMEEDLRKLAPAS